MLLWNRIRAALLGWALAEILLFALIAHVAGFGPTILALLATSLVGLALLKRLGASAQGKLRAAFAGPAGRTGAADGALQALGAVALVLPGFGSDLLGLALLFPPVRAYAAARLGGIVGWRTAGAGGSSAATLDLSPGEWQRTDPERPPTLPR